MTEDGFEHQDAMPEVRAARRPASTFAELAERAAAESSESFAREWAALDVRYLGNSDHNLTDDPSRPARAQLWIRVNGRLGDDPADHLATFTYASDMTLLGATLVPHGVTIGAPRLQAGLARPLDLVPPALPRRRVVALRPVVARRPPGPAASPWRGCSPRTAPWSPRWPRRA